MLQLFAMQVSGADFAEERWKPYLSQKRIEEAGRRRDGRDRQLFLGAEVLLNLALERCAPEVKRPAAYRRNAHGKPYLLPPDDGIFVNWSHSGDYVLLALADREVGVDIQLATVPPRDALVRRVLNAREQQVYDAVPEPRKKKVFYEFWALKESILKAQGTGFGAPLPEDRSLWPTRVLEFRDGDYAAAVCCRGGMEDAEIQYLA
ncbi:MAG: 4'-phosphopantetheinyl transferase superfamily protein [Lachnospiraceae bacterium]|nr:4'-phosphopantetheinyl transferase superfamily protein [Lachnospiraceae bacterium]